ncbi:MAG: murein biosynthesis integral membrane protein MurJ [Elusimicrobia bacterium]|nr:murein biosynthesis integral membrane protein MurJ [Elusimicrobiota bacterium]
MTSSVNSVQYAKHIGGFGLATLFSRILGYFRDAMVVAHFGGGSLSDAFYAAFRVANLVRRTMGEGALSASFVPILAKERQKGNQEAQDFFNALWSGIVILSGSVVLLGILIARPLVLLLTYGFTSDPVKFDLTVELTRILFPHLLFVTMAASCQGALNVVRQFFLPALAPVTFSLSLIAYLLLLRGGIFPFYSPHSQIIGLAVSAVVGGLLEWLLLLPFLFKAGFKLALRNPWSHPGVRQVLFLMGPSVLGLMTDQLDVFVEMIFASFLEEGSFTAIYNANRLMQLPLGLFGVATASVALPHLSEKLGKNDMAQYRETLGLSLRLLGFILLPSSIGLMILSLPIIQTLFQHGRFTLHNSLMTHQALFFACLGLLAYGLLKTIVISFYSLKDAITPLKINTLEVALNATLCYVFMGPLRVGGLTLSASLSSWVSVLILLGLLSRKIGGIGMRVILLSWAKTVAACTVMALFLWMGRGLLAPLLPPFALVLVLVPVGLSSYLLTTHLLKMEERKIILGVLRS